MKPIHRLAWCLLAVAGPAAALKKQK